MRQTVEQIIRNCGTEVILVTEGTEQPVRALLQVVRSKSQDHVQRAFGPLGEVPKGAYVYIGPVEPAAAAGHQIRWNGRKFQIRLAEPVVYGNEVLYIWGLCVEEGGEKLWGT